MDYKYTGNPGNYNGISVKPNEIYKFEKAPNPKLFKLVGNVLEQKQTTQIERPIIIKDDVYTVMEGIHGLGHKLATEIAEEYDNLEDLGKDIENETFSVGGVSSKKIELIKIELGE